jgi:nucleotidyltransferase substrate binding protein (TIGR01987 family)
VAGGDGTPRWVHRLDGFGRALAPLRDAVVLMDARPLSDLEQQGLVQRFEFTWELAWKTLADLLAAEGASPDTVTPRSVVRAALEARLIADGQTWMDALEVRNALAHTYDPRRARDAVAEIRVRFHPAFEALHGDLVRRRDGRPADA